MTLFLIRAGRTNSGSGAYGIMTIYASESSEAYQ